MKIKTVSLTDASDRLEFLKKDQSDSIEFMINKIISEKPFGDHNFYIYVHKRTDEDGVRQRVIWAPRLTKPKASPNTMLFKADPKREGQVRIIWILPEMHTWHLFQKNYLLEDSVLAQSIQAFKKNPADLERPDPDDPDDTTAGMIYADHYPNLFHGT